MHDAVKNTITLLAAVACMHGCGGRNETIGLTGASPPLPALAPVSEGEPPEAEPSLRGLDRSHWTPLVVVVPDDQVEHALTFRAEWFSEWTEQAGAFPTVIDALDTEAFWILPLRAGYRRAPASAPDAAVAGIRLGPSVE